MNDTPPHEESPETAQNQEQVRGGDVPIGDDLKPSPKEEAKMLARSLLEEGDGDPELRAQAALNRARAERSNAQETLANARRQLDVREYAVAILEEVAQDREFATSAATELVEEDGEDE